MTTVTHQDHGPLFAWHSRNSGGAGTSGPCDSTAESGTEIPASPEIPDLRNFGSEKVNDSSLVPDSQIHPLKGGRRTGTFQAPHGSSAALTLRSQRTDRRGLDQESGTTQDPSLRAAQLQPDFAGSEQPALSASGYELRPYQTAAIEAVERAFSSGILRTLLVLATGLGKTVCFAEIIRRLLAGLSRSARALVLAHRTELLEQALGKITAAGVRASIEQGQRSASGNAQAVIASVQTLRGARLDRFAADEFAIIVVDEAHRSEADGYQAIFDRFPNALVLGVTATPNRLDGKPLGNTYQSVAYTYELREGIREEWLAQITARRVRITDVDMSAIKAHHGDLAQDQLSLVLREAKALQGVVGPLVQLAGARKTLLFAVDVAHAHALAELLNKERPGCAMALDGKDPPAKRRAVLDLYKNGAFQFLVNVALFTEGFDEPSIECVAMARPTMSITLYKQMLGRGTRKHPGKRDLLLLDFVGNTRHRLIGAADALAGIVLPEELQAEVDAELANGKPADVELVLAAAEERAAEKLREKALLATAYYRAKEVDPFVGEFLPSFDGASNEPATEQQIKRLTEAPPQGFAFSVPPAGMTMAHAQAIIDAAEERKRRGLSSLPQIRLLRKVGVDARRCTSRRATELVLKCKDRADKYGRAVGYSLNTLRSEPEYDGRTSW